MSPVRAAALILGFVVVCGGCDGPSRSAEVAAIAPQRRGDAGYRVDRVRHRPLTGAEAVAQAAAWVGGGDNDFLNRHARTAGAEAESSDRPLAERPARVRREPLADLSDTIARDIRAMPEDLWEDTRRVFGSAPNVIILGLTYGGALALQETGPDDSIEDALRGKDIFSDDWNEAFGFLGNPATHFGLAGVWYLLGQQKQDEKTFEVGRTLFSALIINGLTTMAGKLATYDRAPNGQYFAFPSGHTSSMFTVASVMHEAYGPLAGAPLYALGVLVSVERLDDGEHYFSDVIMGGVLGLVIGHSIASGHELELFGGRIVPYADPYQQATGIAWHFEF
jgi:hypothetical protein